MWQLVGSSVAQNEARSSWNLKEKRLTDFRLIRDYVARVRLDEPQLVASELI